jgi:hypothetical protein
MVTDYGKNHIILAFAPNTLKEPQFMTSLKSWLSSIVTWVVRIASAIGCPLVHDESCHRIVP